MSSAINLVLRDARIAGRRQVLLRDGLGVAGLQQFADHLTVNLAAELLADHLDRRFAGSKPVQSRALKCSSIAN